MPAATRHHNSVPHPFKSIKCNKDPSQLYLSSDRIPTNIGITLSSHESLRYNAAVPLVVWVYLHSNFSDVMGSERQAHNVTE